MEEKLKIIESLEEEVKRLKSEIEKKLGVKSALKSLSPEKEEQITSEVLKEHIEKYSPEELGEKYRISEQEKEEKIKNLEPEEDDGKIEELLKLVDEKGVINSFDIIKKINNPHLQDDFHRKLIEWWKNKGF